RGRLDSELEVDVVTVDEAASVGRNERPARVAVVVGEQELERARGARPGERSSSFSGAKDERSPSGGVRKRGKRRQRRSLDWGAAPCKRQGRRAADAPIDTFTLRRRGYSAIWVGAKAGLNFSSLC